MRAYPFLVVLLILSGSLFGQTQSATDFDQLLNDLERSLQKGNKRALRDLGSLAHYPQLKDRIRRLFKNYLFVHPDEFEVSNPFDKKAFMQFYYEHEKELSYSHLLNSYYLTSPEARKVKYKIQLQSNEKQADASVSLKKAIKLIEKSVKNRDSPTLLENINTIARLRLPEAYQYLVEFATQQPIDPSTNSEAQKIYETIGTALEDHLDLDAVYTVMGFLDQQLIPLNSAKSILANLTNIQLESDDPQTVLKTYSNFIDSLSTIEEIRAFGYDRLFGFRPDFFVEPVDYYGQILSMAGDRTWIEHNALIDLSYSQHPRALFYIAGLLYKYRKASGKKGRIKSKQLIELMHQLTRIEVGVPNKKEEIHFEAYLRRDQVAKRNFLIYWAAHYNDYEWDENRFLFVNKFEAIEKTQNYERLFRRLNSRNDSVAVASFKLLTEGDPSEVIALAEKYRQMFRTYNKSLPSFQYKYLEQLALLTNFCRKNNFPYKASKTLRGKLYKLSQAKDETERYAIENQIIQSLKLKESTALEYWACLNEGNGPLNYSISRILDWFYSARWSQIISDEGQLRLYLKKAEVFGHIGALGACNAYLNKLNPKNPVLQEKLRSLAKTESDKGISGQLNLLLIEEEYEEESLTLDDFLIDPNSFHKRDIKILPSPQKEDFPKLIGAIQSIQDLKAIRRIFFYIRLHPNIEMVPNLFELIDDERLLVKKRKLELTVADNLAPIFEGIYNYSFPKVKGAKKFNVEPWREMWAQHQDSYTNWIDVFFEQKLKALSESEQLSIDDINQITESVHYNPSYKKICLEALKKVKPVKDIRQLNIEPKLSVQEDLHYFASFDFSHKVIDDIPKLFAIEDAQMMMEYLRKKAANFDLSDRGSLYNDLFRTPWFSNYVGSGVIAPEMAQHIQATLEHYFNESDYLSEFEEQATQLHIAQLVMAGKDLSTQLATSIQLETDEASKAKIQQSIIARIEYQQIPEVIKVVDQLSPDLGLSTYEFLSKDFGLPIFNLESSKAQRKLVEQHQKWTEYEFYFHYLQSFGLNFLKNKNELDYQKIYNILQFDIVTPFVSSSGGKRDNYVYGIIKLLELTFEERLGFHQKLNEGQTFYTFSSTKRAHAWCNYLIENQLVEAQYDHPPSFNPLRAEN
ncbi:MAG: hypothetical protein AAF985_09470 [Bacteroidota bacterium]